MIGRQASQAEGLGLSKSALPLLADLLRERLGVSYEPARFDMLADRLASLVLDRGFDSFLDYYYLLKYDEHAADEWRRVTDALSVPETYFWREVDQLRAVVDEIVPRLASRGGVVRLWTVPCATGEEPLTLAMMLEERGWFARAPIEIHASDASPAAVDRARSGRFRERAFRSLPPELRARYFRAQGDAWVVDPALHARVTSWSVVNLMCEGDVLPRARVPVILCRNVFIYFSPAAVARVVGLFARAMPPEAYLCLGASESLLKLRTTFDLEEMGGAFVYVKNGQRV
ncbi:MAG TPA: CheR family methyltransferase [Vicinamibacterales bacterium]|jgi:chemotaxis protein methyltransferase CheR